MKLSIACTTYNHQEYIKDALDSFLSQELDCEYEIIVADDASKDGTKDILKEYQNKYPGIVKPIFRAENLGLSRNFFDVLQSCNGEYIAYCDGDDYFTDKRKLFKQLKALEANPSCAYSLHDVLQVSSSMERIGLLSKGRKSEHFSTGIIDSKIIFGSPLRIVHANALLFRKEALSDLTLIDKLRLARGADYTLTAALVSRGDCFYIKEVMSAYRHHANSMSAQRRISDEHLTEELIKHFNVVDEHFAGRFNQEIRVQKIGLEMMRFEDKLDEAAENKDLLTFLRVSLQMLANSKGSQYSIRDIIWLVREKARAGFLK